MKIAISLAINAIRLVAAAVVGSSSLLLETSDVLLLETGDKLLLE